MFKVMVVDDEPQVRIALSQIIDIIGNPGEFHVACQAANGREALLCLQEKTIDIVLSDIYMPVLSGIQLASVIERQYPRVVTVFLTGFDDFSLAQQSLRYRVFEYILKPVDQDELLQTLRRAGEEVKRRYMNSKSEHLVFLCKNGSLLRIQERISNRDFTVAVGTARLDAVIGYVKALFDDLIDAQMHQNEKQQIAYWIIYLLGRAYPQLASEESEEGILENELARCGTAEEIWQVVQKNLEQKIRHYSANARIRSQLDNIKEYISREYASVISLQTLADRFSLSPNYISEMFKEDGQNFLDYLTERRLEVAVDMLRNSTLKINQIANDVGYNDANYFNKLFKKHVGISPGEFRNRVTKTRKEG